MATNVCYNALRRSKKDQAVALDDKVIEITPFVASSEALPEEYYERRETQELVRKAVAQLPEKYRLPLVLRYLEDMSYKEIAEHMELPVTTIETRLYRGKSLLQKRLQVLEKGGLVHEVSKS